jgi:hypothetical protein
MMGARAHACTQQRSGYLPQLKKASGLTDQNYAMIGDCLRDRFGQRAGWAFIVLFLAEVHPFRVVLEAQHCCATGAAFPTEHPSFDRYESVPIRSMYNNQSRRGC